MTESLLALHAIHVRDGDRVLLENVSLTLRPGEIHTVIGPNGAGKTTLVRIALGLRTPSAGSRR
ncbi:MAG: ATP-binding cassette domain-containing protein, partial [Moraxellaceae bacterium]